MSGVVLVPEVGFPRSGTEAHCYRVAAIAVELARRRGFDPSTIEPLRRMALGHHSADVPMRKRGLNRLIKGLGLPDAEAEPITEMRMPAGLNGLNELPPQTTTTSGMLVLANLVDEALETLPYFPRSFQQILAEVRTLALGGTIDAAHVECLEPLSTAEDIARAIDALPVFPAVALEVLAELRSEEVPLARIERLASRDQVLTATLLSVANSVLYGVSREIRTVTEAITRVGTEMAAQLIVAASLKPLSATGALRVLWPHSTAMAAVCGELATRAGSIAPVEAGVLGLIHDIGHLVIHTLPREHAVAHTRIVEASGCPVLADYLVCGRDHAELGADLLARWSFPGEIVAAVGFHHRPEATDSRLAAMLYVAEYLTGSEEDIPSISRLAAALNTTGVALADCLRMAARPSRFEAVLNAA